MSPLPPSEGLLDVNNSTFEDGTDFPIATGNSKRLEKVASQQCLNVQDRTLAHFKVDVNIDSINTECRSKSDINQKSPRTNVFNTRDLLGPKPKVKFNGSSLDEYGYTPVIDFAIPKNSKSKTCRNYTEKNLMNLPVTFKCGSALGPARSPKVRLRGKGKSLNNIKNPNLIISTSKDNSIGEYSTNLNLFTNIDNLDSSLREIIINKKDKEKSIDLRGSVENLYEKKGSKPNSKKSGSEAGNRKFDT